MQVKLIYFFLCIVTCKVYCCNFTKYERDEHVIGSMERIKEAGFVGEEHYIQTDDGYLLTIFRIPSNMQLRKQNRTPRQEKMPHKFPILLMHGMLCSSDMFLLKKDALGFKLAQEGYDVWLGNVRGNAYSRNHTTLNPDEEEFWNFSWHEMGLHDLPAIINYVLANTREDQLHYIGMSMGTTVFFVLGTMKPAYMSKIKTMVALAPVAKVRNFSHSAQYNYISKDLTMSSLEDIWKNKKKYELFPRLDMIGKSTHQFNCDDLLEPLSIYCCYRMEIISMMVKGNPVPSGTSLNVPRHYMQLSLSGKFQGYDYGNEETNYRMWNSSTPPEYDLSKLEAPIAVFYTPTDETVSKEDSLSVISALPNVLKVWKAPDRGFTHADFIFTINPRNIGVKLNMTTELLTLLEERNTL